MRDGAQRARVEGRLEGIEAGYALFLPVGRVRGRCDVWRSTVCTQSLCPAQGVPRDAGAAGRVNRRLQALEECLDALYALAADERERFAVLWGRSRSKFRALARLFGEDPLLAEPPADDIEDPPSPQMLP